MKGSAAPPFVFTVAAAPGEEDSTREAYGALAAALQDALPGAAVVVVSAQLGVSVYDEQGCAQDLTELSWDLIEDTAALLGTGAFVLPRGGRSGSKVEEPWKKGGAS